MEAAEEITTEAAEKAEKIFLLCFSPASVVNPSALSIVSAA
jgi:hypothetical protein